MLKKLLAFIMLSGGLMSATAAEIDGKLLAAFQAKGPDYQPRTQHFDDKGQPRFINRLILQDSPYLNQHAHNPVDWYPWGSQAFEAAKQQDKPIFLSIGYSTCHWCHVMEEESFDNIEIARLMNQSFINIKVDREQRPEVDELYMTAVQLMTGHGGWPMSSFLTHEGKTFWAGTYLPPEQFSQVLTGLSEVWLEQRQQVEQQADQVAAAVNKALASKQQSRQLDPEVSKLAVSQIMQGYDVLQGGFSAAPKFPNEPHLLLLLDHLTRFDDPVVMEAVETTLDAMAEGGIYDQIGGGFHRYSVDNEWLVPHFEKMLYNQAQLITVYLQAYQLTGNEFYARIARQSLDYVLRDMTSDEGGFYSATDADSEGEEGTYFVWTPEQIKAALPEQDAQLAMAVFGVTESGNFEGNNILFLQDGLQELAERHQLDYPALLSKLDTIIETLRQVREQRVAPLRDEKVITSWNSMMISSLVLASEILQESHYLAAAERNLAFLLKVNYPRDQLWRVHLNGSSSIPAAQEDYAYLAQALIALYDQTQDQRYLSLAEEMTDTMISRFWDESTGGFYMNIESDVPIMARVKQSLDGAIPAANAVAFNVLTMLSHRSQNLQYPVKADETLAAFSNAIAQFPAAYSTFLVALDKQHLGETGLRRYAGRGTVSIKADIEQQGDNYQLNFLIDIQDGWHINANKPLDNDLIATTVELSDIMGWQLDEVIYPQPITKQLGFSQKTLALYQGQIQITATLSKQDAPQRPVSVRLSLQACSEKVCLAPETIDFRLIR